MLVSRPRTAAVAVGIVAIAAQALAFRDVLLWDDVYLVGRDDLYTNAARWVESVTSPLGRETFYWRPAATTSFLVESLVHGGSAWGFRVTSALLHGATAVTAFALLLRLLRSPKAALLAALAFALHPVNVETVTWISARFDLMAGLFCLAALAAIPAGAGPRSRWILAAVCALAACCSKENAFLLPVHALLWTEAAGGGTGRSRLVPVAWTSAGVAVALFLRFEALGYLFRTRPESVAEAGSATQHLLLVGRATATSLETLLFPWGTVGPAHGGVRPIPADDVLGWTGVGAGVALVALTAFALVRRRRAGLLLAAFLVSLAPASQIVPLDLAGGLHAADRFLYLPSFFAVAAIAAWVTESVAPQPAAARFAGRTAAVLVVALAAGRLAVLPRWNDPLRFWRWAAEMAPGSKAVQQNLAYVHLVAGQLEDAESHARLAGDIGTPVLAEALVRQGRLEAAQKTLNEALARRPADSELHVQRGEVHLALRQFDAAVEDFESAIRAEDAAPGARFTPLLPRALAGSAEALASKPGHSDTALGRVRRAEEIAGAHDAIAWMRITRAWIALHDGVRAAAALRRAEAAGASAGEVAALRAEIGQ